MSDYSNHHKFEPLRGTLSFLSRRPTYSSTMALASPPSCPMSLCYEKGTSIYKDRKILQIFKISIPWRQSLPKSLGSGLVKLFSVPSSLNVVNGWPPPIRYVACNIVYTKEVGTLALSLQRSLERTYNAGSTWWLCCPVVKGSTCYVQAASGSDSDSKLSLSSTHYGRIARYFVHCTLY